MRFPYVELHAHSGYSFLDGASHPEELVLQALEHGYPAMALTDHDGLYGAMEFAQAARQHGLQPITGAEITVHGCLPDLDRHLPPPGPDYQIPVHHLTLLAETPRGYANLSRLITRSRLDSPQRSAPSLPFSYLLQPELTQGIICLTGCRRSPLATALESSQADGEASRSSRAAENLSAMRSTCPPSLRRNTTQISKRNTNA